MKIHKGPNFSAAFKAWKDAEVGHVSRDAACRVDIENYEAPEMTPIEQLVFYALRRSGVDVQPQKKIGKYRVDFLLQGKSQIVVECDGHDFHEKTKEQAQKDKERDRTLQSAGFKVYRFTGSEIWKTDGQCVFDVIDVTEL